MNDLKSRIYLALVDTLPPEEQEKVVAAIDAMFDEYTIEKKVYDVVPVTTTCPVELNYFLGELVIRGLSKKTIAHYGEVLRNFFLATKKGLRDITLADLNRYLAYCDLVRHNNKVTSLHKEIILGTFFKWCFTNEYVNKNPAAKLLKVKVPRRLQPALNELELEKMFSVCKPGFELTLLATMFSTGCRVSEIVNMKRQDINWEIKEITVIGKGNKERVVFLNSRAEVLLKEYLENRTDDSEYLFTTYKNRYQRLTPRTVQLYIKNIAQRAGVKTRTTPHTIRRTMATLGHARGMDVVAIQKILGHESIDTTTRYVIETKEEAKASFKKAMG